MFARGDGKNRDMAETSKLLIEGRVTGWYRCSVIQDSACVCVKRGLGMVEKWYTQTNVTWGFPCLARKSLWPLKRHSPHDFIFWGASMRDGFDQRRDRVIRVAKGRSWGFGNNFSPYCVLEVRLVDRVIENGASCKGNYTSMRCTRNRRAVLRTRLPLEILV